MNISKAKIAYFLALSITFSLTHCVPSFSQSADSSSRVVEIDKIIITGNKKTKDHIILRELDVKPDEKYTISDLEEILESDRNKVYNTKLFNIVEIHILDVSFEKVIIQVEVTERWYIYPIPKISFVDRNFNDWVVNHNADLSRLNIGLKITQFNFRGRNERLHFLIQGGYTKAAGLQYDIPYINKNQRIGMSFRVGYGENTNIAFATIDNKQQFVDSDNIIRTSFLSQVSVTRRNSFYNSHNISIEYNDTWIGDTVISLNPNYFNDSASRQRLFSLGYLYTSDHRDIRAYPLLGYKVSFSIIKRGIGIYNDLNMLHTFTSYSRYWKLPKKFFLSNYSNLYISFPNTQPYANLTGLGYYQNTIRGYELFVVDGKGYLINKTTFKKELFSFRKKIKSIPIEQFQDFPLAVYFKIYFDFGYVNSLTNPELITDLTDTMIYGYGFGVDIVTTYDLVIRTEFSRNSQGGTGFFLHFKKEF